MATLQSTPAFHRLAVPLPGADPLAWLACQPESSVRVYWTARDRGLEVAGLGAACVVTGSLAAGMEPPFARLQAILAQSDPSARFFGGTRFDAPRDDDSAWAGFPETWFVLPEFEVVREADGETRLVANVPVGGDLAAARARLDDLARRANGNGRPPAHLGQPLRRADAPDRDGWERILQSALLATEAGEIEKIVLARRSTLTFAGRLDPLALLRCLRDVTRDCFHFCFQLAAGAAFIGASPERFYRRQGRALETEAVAGTRPRGATPDEDRRLGAELLGSEKDRREHVFVRDMIQEVLQPLCTDVRIDPEPSLLQLARGQHLFSAAAATLRDGVDDAALFARLHPTPAVGGCATPSALARIRAWEPFDRGWYAAPVGWIGRDAAEFAVAIRSALCRDASLSLFSGAGVVSGSDAQAEWDEIEHKIQDFIRILSAERP